MKAPLLFLPLFCFASQVCVFTPPESLASVHLTEEKTDCNLKAYVKSVKEIHAADPHVKWRDLGQITSKAGKGRLTEIRHGEMVTLQATFVKVGTAYTLTAAGLKKDIPAARTDILQAFASLDVKEEGL